MSWSRTLRNVCSRKRPQLNVGIIIDHVGRGSPSASGWTGDRNVETGSSELTLIYASFNQAEGNPADIGPGHRTPDSAPFYAEPKAMPCGAELRMLCVNFGPIKKKS